MRWVKYQWDRVAALVLFIAGLLALLLGWLGASGSVYPAEQLPYMISGGILGIFFLGTAGILYVSADMRDEWRKLDGIEDALRRITPRDDVAAVAPILESDTGPIDGTRAARSQVSEADVADEPMKPRKRASTRSGSTSTRGRAAPVSRS